MPEMNQIPEELPEKALPDGFGKGFVAGVLATLCTGAMFFAGWNAGQHMDKQAGVAEQETENGAEVLTDGGTLQKLDEGTYGICDKTHKPIPVERLEAIPYATLKVEAQEIQEIT